MTSANPTLDADVIVTAVISRAQLPACEIAALRSGDTLDTEPELGDDPIVRLTIGSTAVALASIAKVGGRLIATVIDKRPELPGRKGDTWKVRKLNPQMD